MPKTQKNLCYDVIVVGSGGAGMTAAVVAAQQGLSVAIFEKSHLVGGTTATSGGGVWVPENALTEGKCGGDSLAEAFSYLCNVIGPSCNKQAIKNFLNNASQAIAYLQQNTELKFTTRRFSPDYYSDFPNATKSSRALDTTEYDGRNLGHDLRLIRPARSESELFGGMAVSGTDIAHLRAAFRSGRSFLHALSLITKYVIRRVIFGRDTRLVLGQAMVARLLKTAENAGVDLHLSTPVKALIEERGKIGGIEAEITGIITPIKAKHGIILATGGFGHNRDMIEKWVPYPDQNVAVGAEGTDGDGICMGMAVKGMLSTVDQDSAYWTPVSVWHKRDGKIATFPHLVTDRAKPGIIAVGADARRFVNEADSYHDFVRAMYANGARTIGKTFLICDTIGFKRYGLGLARPWPFPRGRLIAERYLIKGKSIADLAKRLGLDPVRLSDTINRYNIDAEAGFDTEFGKGSSVYNRSMGDERQHPNPCLARIARGPFYAVRIFPGNLGTSRGLQVDHNSRVLDRNAQPIPHLYAVGNDANAVLEGSYPGPGTSLGQALTAGYMAAMHVTAANVVKSDTDVPHRGDSISSKA